jgi:hypothetical protein
MGIFKNAPGKTGFQIKGSGFAINLFPLGAMKVNCPFSAANH